MTVEMHTKPWADGNWLKKSDARGDISSFYACLCLLYIYQIFCSVGLWLVFGQ